MFKCFERPIKFIGLSGVGWIFDLTTYLLLGLFSDNLFVNNMISSWVGVSFVFYFSTRWIFRADGRISLKYKYIIYLVYQFLLITLISQLLAQINLFIVTVFTASLIVQFSSLISKILVTPITMVLNFFAMKIITEFI